MHNYIINLGYNICLTICIYHEIFCAGERLKSQYISWIIKILNQA